MGYVVELVCPPWIFNVSKLLDFLRKWFYLIERLSMSAKSELNHLQARIQKIAPLISPPKLKIIYLKHDDPMPDDLDQWTMPIRIEEGGRD